MWCLTWPNRYFRPDGNSVDNSVNYGENFRSDSSDSYCPWSHAAPFSFGASPEYSKVYISHLAME